MENYNLIVTLESTIRQTIGISEVLTSFILHLVSKMILVANSSRIYNRNVLLMKEQNG